MRALLLLSFPVVALACASRPETHMEHEASSAENYQPGDHDSASDAIAVGRCHREETCGHIGDGKTFASLEQCEHDLRSVTREQVPQCRKFDGIVVDQCLEDIRQLRCGADLSTVENMQSCRAKMLCK